MWHDEVTFQCADGHDRLPCAQPRGDVRLFSPGQRRGVLPEHGFRWPLVTSGSPWALGSCSLCALYVPGLPPPPRCLTKPQDSPHLYSAFTTPSLRVPGAANRIYWFGHQGLGLALRKQAAFYGGPVSQTLKQSEGKHSAFFLNTRMHRPTRKHVHAHTHARTHMQTCACTHTRMCAHLHGHMGTCTGQEHMCARNVYANRHVHMNMFTDTHIPS